uniref:Uncharacterized protein n=1 Tax=Timema poppense TaxID=170557 RepID=A0A7R9H5I5_TIMPO|nr:unnamed protein product [Timema poppensis]
MLEMYVGKKSTGEAKKEMGEQITESVQDMKTMFAEEPYLVEINCRSVIDQLRITVGTPDTVDYAQELISLLSLDLVVILRTTVGVRGPLCAGKKNVPSVPLKGGAVSTCGFWLRPSLTQITAVMLTRDRASRADKNYSIPSYELLLLPREESNPGPSARQTDTVTAELRFQTRFPHIMRYRLLSVSQDHHELVMWSRVEPHICGTVVVTRTAVSLASCRLHRPHTTMVRRPTTMDHPHHIITDHRHLTLSHPHHILDPRTIMGLQDLRTTTGPQAHRTITGPQDHRTTTGPQDHRTTMGPQRTREYATGRGVKKRKKVAALVLALTRQP